MAGRAPARKKRSVFRRVERWMVGLAMGVMAFVLERVVMRSVRKRGKRDPAPKPTTLSSKGGDVDLPEQR